MMLSMCANVCLILLIFCRSSLLIVAAGIPYFVIVVPLVMMVAATQRVIFFHCSSACPPVCLDAYFVGCPCASLPLKRHRHTVGALNKFVKQHARHYLNAKRQDPNYERARVYQILLHLLLLLLLWISSLMSCVLWMLL